MNQDHDAAKVLVQLVEDNLVDDCGHEPLDPCCVVCAAHVEVFHIRDRGDA